MNFNFIFYSKNTVVDNGKEGYSIINKTVSFRESDVCDIIYVTKSAIFALY